MKSHKQLVVGNNSPTHKANNYSELKDQEIVEENQNINISERKKKFNFNISNEEIKEFKNIQMKRLFPGMFNKDVSMFYGDKIEYAVFYKDEEGKEIILKENMHDYK